MGLDINKNIVPSDGIDTHIFFTELLCEFDGGSKCRWLEYNKITKRINSKAYYGYNIVDIKKQIEEILFTDDILKQKYLTILYQKIVDKSSIKVRKEEKGKYLDILTNVLAVIYKNYGDKRFLTILTTERNDENPINFEDVILNDENEDRDKEISNLLDYNKVEIGKNIPQEYFKESKNLSFEPVSKELDDNTWIETLNRQKLCMREEELEEKNLKIEEQDKQLLGKQKELEQVKLLLNNQAIDFLKLEDNLLIELIKSRQELERKEVELDDLKHSLSEQKEVLSKIEKSFGKVDSQVFDASITILNELNNTQQKIIERQVQLSDLEKLFLLKQGIIIEAINCNSENTDIKIGLITDEIGITGKDILEKQNEALAFLESANHNSKNTTAEIISTIDEVGITGKNVLRKQNESIELIKQSATQIDSIIDEKEKHNMKMQEMLLGSIEESNKKENRFLDQQTDLKDTYKTLDNKIENIKSLSEILDNTNDRIDGINERQNSILKQNKKQFDFSLNALVILIIVLIINVIFAITFLKDKNWEMAIAILLSMLLILASVIFIFKDIRK